MSVQGEYFMLVRLLVVVLMIAGPIPVGTAVVVYIYGNHSDLHKGKAKAIEAKTLTLSLKTTDPATTVKLEAKPTKEDPEGKASVFMAKNDAFKTDKKLVGSISGKLGTKPYTGDFKQKKGPDRPARMPLARGGVSRTGTHNPTKELNRSGGSVCFRRSGF